MQTYESVLNVRLADELKSRGLNAAEEAQQPGNRRIDVAVRIGTATVAVEAEHGQSISKQREAIKDADARLKQGLAQCAVAVCYPDGTTKDSLNATKELIWTVRGDDDAEIEATWQYGDLDQLASVIRLTPAQLGDPDAVAASLSISLDIAVNRLNEVQKQRLAAKLDLPHDKKAKSQRWDKAAKRALLVVATAVMFHSRLDGHLAEMKPELEPTSPSPSIASWPPQQAALCLEKADPIGEYSQAWKLILTLDYKPIFETARAALLSCPPDPAFSAAVADTARAALAVAANVASFRHDLLGRIFHTVLDTARYDGSFYTTTPAATLLASLAIGEDTCDWNDIEAVGKLRITDPACGTGTLLMAAAERIRELAPHFRDQGEPARILIEKVLTGYDINLTATHMAATTLGLLSPSTQFQKMKIYRALLGIDESGNARLGSLELLDRDPMLMTWPNPTQPVQQIDSGEALGPDLREPSDLVIMNPPFTRDSLRHDQFDQNDEKQLKAREKEIFTKSSTHLSGNSGGFLVLADYITNSETSAIASVLPLVTATNASSLKIRQFLASNYHIETIITSHDLERIYFSENTNIGEMLLVCRKWRDRDKGKPPTKVVNLSINPSTPADALNVAKSIENDTVESQNFGTVQEVPASTIADGDWGAVQFLSPYLRARFIALRDGDMFSVIKLGRIADIGPDGRGIRGNFIRSSMPGEKGMTALWHHKTDITQSMAANTDCHIRPQRGREKQCEHLWSQRGRLLLPTRIRLNTVRTLSVRLDTSALGSGWVPCKPRASGVADEVMEKSICVYLNSALGVLAVLGNRSSKLLSYPQLSMDDLRKLAVPDFSDLGDETVMKLARTYDVLATHKLKPLPEMQSDDVRHALDGAICDALGIDPEEVGMIRNSLGLEPSVTGKRYQGKR